MLFQGLRQDIKAIRERDPAARNCLEVLLLYSGLHALMLHRPAYWLYQHKCYFSARLISQFARWLTGIEIHPGAKVGRGVLIDHGAGTVIGETAVVGNGCTIYQGVTLGGTGKDKGKRHPTLEENVMVGCGAKILGPFTVKAGSKVAANAVVLSPMPENSTAVGVPARVVKVGKRKIDNTELDQVHVPDPVSLELCKMRMLIDRLEARVKELEAVPREGEAESKIL